MQHNWGCQESNRGEIEHVKAAELLYSWVGFCNNLEKDYHFSHREKSELPTKHEATMATITGKKDAV